MSSILNLDTFTTQYITGKFLMAINHNLYYGYQSQFSLDINVACNNKKK